MQCFGAPFIVAHMENGEKEAFFGSDRMELLAFVIGMFMVTCVCVLIGIMVAYMCPQGRNGRGLLQN